jgi:hypothetical protein
VPVRPEELLRLAGLDERARVHDRDPLAHPGDDAEVVRDQDERGVVLDHELVQKRKDLRLDRDVERRRRLVRDQELRLARERHRDHHALPHAARERPARERIPSNASAVTLLPEPDSPTMPSVSPGATANETPLTA